MSTARTAERATAQQGESRAAARMVTWQGCSVPRLEQVRVLVSEHKLRASGRIVASGPAEQFNGSFELSVGEDGAVTRLLLRTATVAEERHVSLSRSSDGVWMVDRGHGGERADFDGAVDVDVEFAVLFAAIPVRRLGLHREPGEAELPVVRVSLPDLDVTVVRRGYRTASVGDGGSVVAIRAEDGEQDVTVDAEGLVVDYPDVAQRI
ncbi:putative glycolipid-binding domain-containing protein [Actinosynnema pretiosum subsp. pretiosum]|uniref:Glycolipid-binding domain-containing protein n=2 Tax=Actinosynnema TaxID=40566 RepID=C6WDY9_ACTMD|nr:putative glycolipid-binding domain-containing protein [Actinosynnema mirum]ACU34134.1 protein of unknown function DUF1089 [Actinosynnema mirum DSM 43827]AXX27531.1 hypothetical protein APASM_0166 [Actinosynnema pretiosum subsp. pretiosum]QUF01757.1 putative glycolipid-binding domain-containing protein [Actinosynnema pretiosum subsp. pretiosum]